MLDELTQKKLDSITAKEVLALTDSDIAFLKARKEYLTDGQVEIYEEIFSKEPSTVKQSDPRRSRTYRAMQSQAKELGLKYVGVSREDLERSIDTVVGPR